MKSSTVFISYSHRDKKFLDELLAHLTPFVRSGSVTAWSDKQIAPGSKWLAEIQAALGRAGVAVLLVSPQFLASDFIHDHELGPLLKAAETKGVKILWVQVRASSYQETPLEAFQAVVSPPAKPLAEMKAERDRAWVQVCGEIKKAVGGSPVSTGAPLQPGQPGPEHLRRAVHRSCPALLWRSRPQGRLSPRPWCPPRRADPEGAHSPDPRRHRAAAIPAGPARDRRAPQGPRPRRSPQGAGLGKPGSLRHHHP